METQTERESRGTKWIANGRRYTAECLNCGAQGNTYTHPQLHRGDDDGPFYSDMKACGANGCEVILCPNCDQFSCDECGADHCKSHMKIWTDGDVSMRLCPTCFVRGEE